MDVNVEKLEKSTALIKVSIPWEDFEEEINRVYRKDKNRFNIPGFRRGHATRALIEKLYGEGVFYEEAAENTINGTYPAAMKESGLDIVSRPSVDIKKISKGEPFCYEAKVAVKPEVVLGEYKGIEVERADQNVSESEVDAELKKTQEANARIITVEDKDYGIVLGDTAVIDFEGFTDGEAFAGGKGEDYPLEIGSGSFIDNFEEQLIGHSLNDNVDVIVTFPEEYGEKSLEGKEALFKVVIKEIKHKELPELDDEFAAEVSEFDTLSEYREDVLRSLKEKKERQAAQENEARVIKAVTDAASVEFPHAMIEQGIDDRVEDIEAQLKNQGIPLDRYLALTGQTMEALRESLREDVTERFKVRLVFEKIAEEEGISAGEEAVDNELKALSERYHMSEEEVKNIVVGDELIRLKDDIRVREALDMVVAEAKLTDPGKKEKKKAKKSPRKPKEERKEEVEF